MLKKTILGLFVFLTSMTLLWAQDRELQEAFREQGLRRKKLLKKLESLSPTGASALVYFSEKTSGQIFNRFFQRQMLPLSGRVKGGGKKTSVRLFFKSLSNLRFYGQNSTSFRIHFGITLEEEKKKSPLKGHLEVTGTLGRSSKANCLNLSLKLQKIVPGPGVPADIQDLIKLFGQQIQQKDFVVGPILERVPLRLSRHQTLDVPLRIDFLKIQLPYAAFEVNIPSSSFSPTLPPLPGLLSPQDREDPMESLGENEDILGRIEKMVEEAVQIQKKAFSQKADLLVELKPALAYSLARVVLPHTAILGKEGLKGKVFLDFIGDLKITPQGIVVEARGGFLFDQLSARKYPILYPIFPQIRNKKVFLTLGLKVNLHLSSKGRLQFQVEGKIQGLKFSRKESLSSALLGKTLAETLNLFLQKRLSSFQIPWVRFYVPLFERRPALRMEPQGLYLSYNRVYVVMETRLLKYRR